MYFVEDRFSMHISFFSLLFKRFVQVVGIYYTITLNYATRKRSYITLSTRIIKGLLNNYRADFDCMPYFKLDNE